MCLDFCRPRLNYDIRELLSVCTPLDVTAWDRALRSHPDRAFARYITEGLRNGFRIGFHRGRALKSAPSNMGSAKQHPEVMTKYITDELSKGRMLGPFPLALESSVHISRIGVIPKGHNTGKWRLITDLSFPHGQSVNDGIDASLCSLSYITVDKVAEIAVRLGKGSLLAKIDIESAYRLIPVHPQDRPLQAVEWNGEIYVDPMLPFGLRSAPKIFNAVADALEWYLRQSGIDEVEHYLDDFIVIGPPNSSQCQSAMAILDNVCRQLRLPIAEHKRDGPTTCLIFLGIVIDTLKGELRLPTDKLQRLQSLLQAWGDKKACSRTELESLIGLLNHACKVVRSGRSFLRRMIDLLHSSSHRPGKNTLIRLNTGLRADLAWWNEFVGAWNGISYLPPSGLLPTVEMTSDASGSWGCGAWHDNSWFQVQWDSRSRDLLIAVKELIPIVMACATWGAKWRGHRVVCHCDNQVVVACLRTRSSRHEGIMHLLRCLVFIEAHFDCFLHPEYIDTKQNHLADDLSRDNLPSFLSKVPGAAHSPAKTSRPLLDLLLNPQADWISLPWRRQFSDTFKVV